MYLFRDSTTVLIVFRWFASDGRTIIECGAVSGIIIGKRNLSARRKPAPVPLCTAQIPRGMPWDRTGAASVRSRRLTA
jgi:hypothetical protein